MSPLRISFIRVKLRQMRSYHEVSYQTIGDPIDVLKYRKTSKQMPLSDDVVHVQMIHAPWNPADVNTVQGKYPSPVPVRPKDLGGAKQLVDVSRTSRQFDGCSVAGSEGWGRVVAASGSSSPMEGELVTMGLPGMGTMTSDLIVPSTSLLPLGDKGEAVFHQLGPSGSSLFQLGGTALQMLTNFASLTDYAGGSKEGGHVVIQNAGTSGVALLTSQLASVLFKMPVVSIVRRGRKTSAQYEELIHHLLSTGKNSLVVAEEDLMNGRAPLKDFQVKLRDLSSTHQLPILALNAVGGPSSSILLKCLEPGGTMVTYGGMSQKPVQVSTPQLIFKNVHVVGYWHSRWMVENHQGQQRQKKIAMINTLMDAVLHHDIKCPPARTFGLSEIDEALRWNKERTRQPESIRQKLVFDCGE